MHAIPVCKNQPIISMTTFEYASMIVLKLSEAEAKDIAQRIETAYKRGTSIEVPAGSNTYEKCFRVLFENQWSLFLAHDAATKIQGLLEFKKKVTRIALKKARQKSS